MLDLIATTWCDCWPISEDIVRHYPQHPAVRIQGLTIDRLDGPPGPAERRALTEAQVFTAMNRLNELVGLGIERLRARLRHRLAALPSGALVLDSDLAGYPDCTQGMTLLWELLLEREATILLNDRGEVQAMANRLDVPPRIAWMHGAADPNRFRLHVKQIRLAAALP